MLRGGDWRIRCGLGGTRETWLEGRLRWGQSLQGLKGQLMGAFKLKGRLGGIRPKRGLKRRFKGLPWVGERNPRPGVRTRMLARLR